MTERRSTPIFKDPNWGGRTYRRIEHSVILLTVAIALGIALWRIVPPTVTCLASFGLDLIIWVVIDIVRFDASPLPSDSNEKSGMTDRR